MADNDDKVVAGLSDAIRSGSASRTPVFVGKYVLITWRRFLLDIVISVCFGVMLGYVTVGILT